MKTSSRTVNLGRAFPIDYHWQLGVVTQGIDISDITMFCFKLIVQEPMAIPISTLPSEFPKQAYLSFCAESLLRAVHQSLYVFI